MAVGPQMLVRVEHQERAGPAGKQPHMHSGQQRLGPQRCREQRTDAAAEARRYGSPSPLRSVESSEVHLAKLSHSHRLAEREEAAAARRRTCSGTACITCTGTRGMAAVGSVVRKRIRATMRSCRAEVIGSEKCTRLGHQFMRSQTGMHGRRCERRHNRTRCEITRGHSRKHSARFVG